MFSTGIPSLVGASKARKREKVRSSSKKGEKSQHKEEADTNQVSHVPSEVVGSLKRNNGTMINSECLSNHWYS